jgi:hypothetical protein
VDHYQFRDRARKAPDRSGTQIVGPQEPKIGVPDRSGAPPGPAPLLVQGGFCPQKHRNKDADRTIGLEGRKAGREPKENDQKLRNHFTAGAMLEACD